jgi:sec-independent protein translocase protein TatA
MWRGKIMFGHFGLPELLIILVILLLIFGPSRLGDLGASLGKGIKGFRKSMKDDEIDVTPPKDESKQINDPNLETTGTPSESKKNVQ